MIESKETAEEINKLMLEYGAKLDASVERVQKTCSDAEFKSYRKAVGIIMGEMLLNVMNPLYDKHPYLKPKELS